LNKQARVREVQNIHPANSKQLISTAATTSFTPFYLNMRCTIRRVAFVALAVQLLVSAAAEVQKRVARLHEKYNIVHAWVKMRFFVRGWGWSVGYQCLTVDFQNAGCSGCRSWIRSRAQSRAGSTERLPSDSPEGPVGLSLRRKPSSSLRSRCLLLPSCRQWTLAQLSCSPLSSRLPLST